MSSIKDYKGDASLHPLLDRLADGEQIRITRGGKPVARLMPASDPESGDDIRRAIEGLKEFREGNTLGPGLTMRDMIEEGRR